MNNNINILFVFTKWDLFENFIKGIAGNSSLIMIIIANTNWITFLTIVANFIFNFEFMKFL